MHNFGICLTFPTTDTFIHNDKRIAISHNYHIRLCRHQNAKSSQQTTTQNKLVNPEWVLCNKFTHHKNRQQIGCKPIWENRCWLIANKLIIIDEGRPTYELVNNCIHCCDAQTIIAIDRYHPTFSNKFLLEHSLCPMTIGRQMEKYFLYNDSYMK